MLCVSERCFFLSPMSFSRSLTGIYPSIVFFFPLSPTHTRTFPLALRKPSLPIVHRYMCVCLPSYFPSLLLSHLACSLLFFPPSVPLQSLTQHTPTHQGIVYLPPLFSRCSPHPPPHPRWERHRARRSLRRQAQRLVGQRVDQALEALEGFAVPQRGPWAQSWGCRHGVREGG